MSEATTGGPGPAGDVATVTVFVEVDQADAFEVFTAEIDQWWRQGPAFRIAGRRRGELHFEPGVGGRLFETFTSPSGASRTLVVGRVLVWEPPARLAFEWRGVNFKPHESTRVEVTFASFADGTEVTVCHRGWSQLPADHPARHGLAGAAFVRRIGLWWGSLLTGLREHCAERSAERPG